MPPEVDQRITGQSGAKPSDDWSGPWGIIEPVPQSVETLCLQIEGESGRSELHYYPYRTIGKWTWNMASPEILEIFVGGTQVVISGSGLRRLAEALKTGQLKLVQCASTQESDNEINILAIKIDN